MVSFEASLTAFEIFAEETILVVSSEELALALSGE